MNIDSDMDQYSDIDMNLKSDINISVGYTYNID